MSTPLDPEEHEVTKESFRVAFQLIVAAANGLRMLPLEKLIRMMEQSDASGWIFDPTAYIATQKTRDLMLRVFRAAVVFRAALPTLQEAAEADALQREVRSRSTLGDLG